MLEQGIQIVASYSEVSDAIELDETMASLPGALRALLPQQRDLVQKVFFEGKSGVEVIVEFDRDLFFALLEKMVVFDRGEGDCWVAGWY